MILNTNLNGLAKLLHSKSKAKGFWDEPRETGTLLMLIVSELSEALEADRKDKRADLLAFTFREEDRANPEDFIVDFQQLIKDTFEDEIADTFIRLFDLVGALDIDIDQHIRLKMEYNQTREYRHGKAY